MFVQWGMDRLAVTGDTLFQRWHGLDGHGLSSAERTKPYRKPPGHEQTEYRPARDWPTPAGRVWPASNRRAGLGPPHRHPVAAAAGHTLDNASPGNWRARTRRARPTGSPTELPPSEPERKTPPKTDILKNIAQKPAK
jgi:hypothetical protein